MTKHTNIIKAFKKDFYFNDGTLSAVNVHDASQTIESFLTAVISQVREETEKEILKEIQDTLPRYDLVDSLWEGVALIDIENLLSINGNVEDKSKEEDAWKS